MELSSPVMDGPTTTLFSLDCGSLPAGRMPYPVRTQNVCRRELPEGDERRRVCAKGSAGLCEP